MKALKMRGEMEGIMNLFIIKEKRFVATFEYFPLKYLVRHVVYMVRYSMFIRYVPLRNIKIIWVILMPMSILT